VADASQFFLELPFVEGPASASWCCVSFESQFFLELPFVEGRTLRALPWGAVPTVAVLP